MIKNEMIAKQFQEEYSPKFVQVSNKLIVGISKDIDGQYILTAMLVSK